MINIEVLLRYKGDIKEFGKDEIILREGEEPKYYYQIIQGKIKMNNYSIDGKEFIQGIFSEGESFGEPPLFLGIGYPANAIALEDSKIVVIKKEDFLHLLEQEKGANLGVLEALSARLYYKSIMAPDISSNDSCKRIMTLLNYLKEQRDVVEHNEFQVELTRQQIADLTGLRVETVIRSIKEIESRKLIRIVRGKIFI